ncbi:uncharacterized serine-rich protein C215.13 [Hyalella azteca]|uniref:Uncharacterized serine-rich protein C215.13 n=1 Tax=Hyalella azteca TaxID=294128 RepID=A0A8B7PGI9_HYAAZ|nr:uncharacterized serine-rich protein C215.13 [Hyalella azteca]
MGLRFFINAGFLLLLCTVAVVQVTCDASIEGVTSTVAPTDDVDRELHTTAETSVHEGRIDTAEAATEVSANDLAEESGQSQNNVTSGRSHATTDDQNTRIYTNLSEEDAIGTNFSAGESSTLPSEISHVPESSDSASSSSTSTSTPLTTPATTSSIVSSSSSNPTERITITTTSTPLITPVPNHSTSSQSPAMSSESPSTATSLTGADQTLTSSLLPGSSTERMEISTEPMELSTEPLEVSTESYQHTGDERSLTHTTSGAPSGDAATSAASAANSSTSTTLQSNYTDEISTNYSHQASNSSGGATEARISSHPTSPSYAESSSDSVTHIPELIPNANGTNGGNVTSYEGGTDNVSDTNDYTSPTDLDDTRAATLKKSNTEDFGNSTATPPAGERDEKVTADNNDALAHHFFAVTVTSAFVINAAFFLLTLFCVYKIVKRYHTRSWSPQPVKYQAVDYGISMGRQNMGLDLSPETHGGVPAPPKETHHKDTPKGYKDTPKVPITITNEDGWCVPYADDINDNNSNAGPADRNSHQMHEMNNEQRGRAH